ncbi:hypothetical protein [Clostridium chromiireducens]|nr:hypothetical protein [Clostridium chromiireducens]
MNYKVGKSSKRDLSDAVSEATAGLKSPKLILFFSDVKNFETYTI